MGSREYLQVRQALKNQSEHNAFYQMMFAELPSILYLAELTMPPELRKAHQNNDRAVMQAYGFSIKNMTESKCVAELMGMYLELTKK